MNRFIKYLPRIGNQGLSTSNDPTLSNTQLCGIMIHGCQKEWADQYDAKIDGISNNIDVFLKCFETYDKLDDRKQALMSILCKPVVGCSGGNRSKLSRGRAMANKERKSKGTA